MSIGEWPVSQPAEKVNGSEMAQNEEILSDLKKMQAGPDLTEEEQKANLRALQERQFSHKVPLRKSKLR